MRIIDQSEETSFSFDSIDVWRNEKVIYASKNGADNAIGKYDSARRAKEVFIDIHNSYCEGDSVYYMPKE